MLIFVEFRVGTLEINHQNGKFAMWNLFFKILFNELEILINVSLNFFLGFDVEILETSKW